MPKWNDASTTGLMLRDIARIVTCIITRQLVDRKTVTFPGFHSSSMANTP